MEEELAKGRELFTAAEKEFHHPHAEMASIRALAAQAIEQLDLAIGRRPSAEAHYWRGCAHALRREEAEAESDFTASLGIDAKYSVARVARGKLQAARWLERFIDSGGGSRLKGAALKAAERERVGAMADFGVAAASVEVEAFMDFLESKFDACIDACDRGGGFELLVLKGHALFFSSSVDAYRRRSDEASKQLEAAVAAYTRAIEIRAACVEALAMRAYVQSLLDRREEAMKDAERALKIDPRGFLALILSASLAGGERALELYTRALEVKSDSFFARCNRSVVYVGLGRTDDALKDLEEAITLNADHVFGWQLKGAVLARVKRYDEAEEVLSKAIDLDPDFPTIWYNRGAVRAALGRKDEAIADFKEAIERGHPNAEKVKEIIKKLDE